MRTTLAIADDVLMAAKAIAREQGKTLGDVVSELARRSLRKPSRPRSSRNRFPLLPAQKAETIVTIDIVNALRNDERFCSMSTS